MSRNGILKGLISEFVDLFLSFVYHNSFEVSNSPCVQDWSGALACPDSSGRWMAVAAYHSATNSPPLTMVSLLSVAVREATKQLIKRGLAMPRYFD